MSQLIRLCPVQWFSGQSPVSDANATQAKLRSSKVNVIVLVEIFYKKDKENHLSSL